MVVGRNVCEGLHMKCQSAPLHLRYCELKTSVIYVVCFPIWLWTWNDKQWLFVIGDREADSSSISVLQLVERGRKGWRRGRERKRSLEDRNASEEKRLRDFNEGGYSRRGATRTQPTSEPAVTQNKSICSVKYLLISISLVSAWVLRLQISCHRCFSEWQAAIYVCISCDNERLKHFLV